MIWPVETPSVSPARSSGRTSARRGVDAGEEVLERLDEGEPHVLLLQRQAHLGGEWLLDLRRRETERLRELSRLEGDDDQVDEVGQIALDLLLRFLAREFTMIIGSIQPMTTDATVARAEPRRQPGEACGESQTSSRATALRNCIPSRRSGVVVHPGCDQSRPVVVASEPREVLSEPPSDGADHVVESGADL